MSGWAAGFNWKMIVIVTIYVLKRSLVNDYDYQNT